MFVFAIDPDVVPASGFPIPVEQRAYFERVLAVRSVEQETAALAMWPGQFKAREKRPPTWAEIEAAWPRVGAWIASEREAAR